MADTYCTGVRRPVDHLRTSVVVGAEEAPVKRRFPDSGAGDGAGLQPAARATADTDAGFVGRAAEVARVRAALRRPPCVVVVRGEAGAGTSRLVDEALADDGLRDCAQVRGVCPDVPEGAALVPVADALAGLPYRTDGADTPLPPLTGVVATLVPELADRLPEPPAAAADPETRRGLLPRAVRLLLAAHGPVVMVVEDVHWADPATRDLLHRLLADLPPGLRLVLTERRAPGLPALGIRVPDHVLVEEVEVRPWTPEETGEFVRRRLRERATEPGAAEEVHARTGGFPDAAEALLRAVCHGGIPGAADGAAPAEGVVRAVGAAEVPARLRRDMAQRRGPLTDDAQRVVEAAAVLELPVTVHVLAEVAGLEPERTERAVAQAVRRSVLRADGPHPGFRHPLDRQAVLDEVPGPGLAWLSLRAARALQRRGAPLPLAELARLYRAAGRTKESLRCLVTAADRAAAEGDYTAATTLYTQAVTEDPRAAGRIRIAAKLARTAQLARAGEQVVSAVRRVLDEDAPPPRLSGEMRLHLGVVLRNQSGGALDSLEEVARAIPDLEVSDPQTAVRAMLVAAIPSIQGWPVQRHAAWLERAEAVADRVTDPVARAAMAANRATALMLLGDHRAWAAAEALRGPAGSVMEAAQYARGWTNLAHASMALGHAAKAREFLFRAADGLADTSSPYLEGLTQTGRLVLAWHEGGWERLHQDADHTTRLYQEIPDLAAEAMLVRGLTALHVLGDVPRARRDLTEAARTARYDTGVIITASAAALARVHLEAGRPGQACDAVEGALRHLERTGGWVWATEVAPTAVEALCGSGQTTRAHRIVADFDAGTAGRDAPAARAALTVCRALLAEDGQRHDRAALLLAEAEAQWRRLGRLFDAARTAEARGRCLLPAPEAAEQDGAERRQTAVDTIHAVIEQYQMLGARWDVARCHRLLRRHAVVTTHRRGRLGYGDQLSPREQEVARLVVQGRANRDIAESLVLSTRTVEHHVARIMRKLNVSSRTDIAAAGDDGFRLRTRPVTRHGAGNPYPSL
ncbi:LuxR C-terminal-related transcriptional regulator [Streptomyces sp. G6]|uniref:LuxR C-terminal-related transcriptional regulator n=1 Tax=Streptomyces sp. G6 TaxID=1178736 RepID=UPI003ED8A8B4